MSDQILPSYHADWSNAAYNKLPGLHKDLRHKVKADLKRIRKLYIEAMKIRGDLKALGLDVLIPVEQKLVAADRQLKALKEAHANLIEEHSRMQEEADRLVIVP